MHVVVVHATDLTNSVTLMRYALISSTDMSHSFVRFRFILWVSILFVWFLSTCPFSMSGSMISDVSSQSSSVYQSILPITGLVSRAQCSRCPIMVAFKSLNWSYKGGGALRCNLIVIVNLSDNWLLLLYLAWNLEIFTFWEQEVPFLMQIFREPSSNFCFINAQQPKPSTDPRERWTKCCMYSALMLHKGG